MWKSPIEIQIEAAQTELIEKEEQLILNMTQQVTSRVINKQQLLDALDYDSKQYKQGYISAVKDILQLIDDFELDQEFGFDFSYWFNKLLREKGYDYEDFSENPPDNCDYETGYDPFLGCITDDC